MVELEQIEEIISSCKLEGHFLLSSGLHSPVYLEKFRIFSQPAWVEKLSRVLAEHFRESKIEAVAGPALGGIILAYEVAQQLKALALYLEKFENKKVLRRGQSVREGIRVLVVDDVLTTGNSIRQSIQTLTSLGAQVVGIGVLVDRSQKEIDFGFPLFACYRFSAPLYHPSECPQCKEGLPLIRLGSGATL